MPHRARGCERRPVGVRKHPCVRPHAPSHCLARALAARGREYAGSRPHNGSAPWGTRYRMQYPIASSYSVVRPRLSAAHDPFHCLAQIIPRTGPRVPYPRGGGAHVPAPLPSAHDCRTSPLRVLSEPAATRGGTQSAPPCRAYSLSALREAVCASTAQVPLPPPCACPRSTGPCVGVASELSSIRTRTMEGVCALRHGWSTFRRPGTKRARLQHPPRVPVCSTLSDEDPMRPPRAVLV